MVKEREVKIYCPACGTPLVLIFPYGDINCIFQHKCAKCKRYWRVDYKDRDILWLKGKEESTTIKRYRLNLDTGKSLPLMTY